MVSKKATGAVGRLYAPAMPHPGRENMERFQHLLAAARSPLVILGGPGWTHESCNDMQRFVEANQLPCACAFRYQDLFANPLDTYMPPAAPPLNPLLPAPLPP